MKLCPSCKKEVPLSIVIDGKKRNLCNRKYCLNCSPMFGHNTRKLNKPLNTSEPITNKSCAKCLLVKPIEDFYKKSKREQQYLSYCKKCSTQQVLERMRLYKLRCIEYKGGKCQKCGYNKYIGALEFHHRNPEEKDFTIARQHLHKFNDKTKDELDKCDLLCANCHRETHGNIS